MSKNSFSTLAEVAESRHINVKTLLRRMAECGVRGVKPGRARLLTEADIAKLDAHLDQRATALAPVKPPLAVVNLRRQLHRSETKRLLQRVK